MTFNELILGDIKAFFDDTPVFNKKDLITAVGRIFDSHKASAPRKSLKLGRGRKEEKEEKSKREPTGYQLFVKTTLPGLKARENAKGDGEVKLKQTDLIKEVAKMWKDRPVAKDVLIVQDTPPSSPVANRFPALSKKSKRGKKEQHEVVNDSE